MPEMMRPAWITVTAMMKARSGFYEVEIDVSRIAAIGRVYRNGDYERGVDNAAGCSLLVDGQWIFTRHTRKELQRKLDGADLEDKDQHERHLASRA